MASVTPAASAISRVVVPLKPEQPWDPVRAFCRSFAESVSDANPEKYLAHVKIADRRGRKLRRTMQMNGILIHELT